VQRVCVRVRWAEVGGRCVCFAAGRWRTNIWAGGENRMRIQQNKVIEFS